MTKTQHFSARLTLAQAEKLQRLAERLDTTRGRLVGRLIDQAIDAPPPALYATNPVAEVSQAAATGFAQCNP